MSLKWTDIKSVEMPQPKIDTSVSFNEPTGLTQNQGIDTKNAQANLAMMDRISNLMSNMQSAYQTNMDKYNTLLGNVRDSLTAMNTPQGTTPIVKSTDGTVQQPTAITGIPTDKSFGWLSRLSETGSDTTGHSSFTPNDGGGQSIGEQQFHSMKGSMGDFIESIKSTHPQLYSQMRTLFPHNAPTYSPEYIKFWNDNEVTLKPLAREFSKNQFYTNRLGILSPEMQARIKSDPRLGEIFYSFNVNGSQGSFKNSGITPDMPFEDIVKRVYGYRTSGLDGNGSLYYYKGFSPDMQRKILANVLRERDRILSTPKY